MKLVFIQCFDLNEKVLDDVGVVEVTRSSRT